MRIGALNIWTRSILFGAGSGFAWSLAPGLLGLMFFGSIIPLPFLLIGCVFIGVLVSSALTLPLLNTRNWLIAMLLGVFALAMAAFSFGCFFGLFLHFVNSDNETPVETGLSFIAMSTGSLFAVILVPCAVLTTFLMWKVLHADWAKV